MVSNYDAGNVLMEVDEELSRQHAKWGEQNHPDGTGLRFFREKARTYRQQCNDATAAGAVTWRDILLEEVFEALAESDGANLRTELVQVAAVATQWAMAIDRRAGRGAK